MDADVERVAAAIARRDWAAVRPLLHPYLHWTGPDGRTVRGRDKVLAELARRAAPTAPDSYELRDGQVYRWREPRAAVHRVAEEGFGREAEVYERSRPSYPPDAVAWLMEHLRIRPGATVADLAAGTGKLTRLLHPAGARLVAVEPVAGMRDVLRRVVPDVAVVAGTAEALPVRSSSLDAVTIAQAFHWFDAERAFVELCRVLRPGGRAGMVWNARDRSVGWVDRLWGIMDRLEKAAPWRDHENWRESAFGARPGFGPVHSATFSHEQAMTPDGVVERFKGVSHVAALPPGPHDAVLAEVREVLATDPDTRGRDVLRIPYRVDCFWTERR